MKQSIKPIRRSEKQIRALLSIQDKSDIPVTAFCKAHQIHKATYYNWRNKYGSQIETAARFIPVQLSQGGSEPALFGEIEFPSKVIVKLYQQVDASCPKCKTGHLQLIAIEYPKDAAVKITKPAVINETATVQNKASP